jgi:hypothetical protein
MWRVFINNTCYLAENDTVVWTWIRDGRIGADTFIQHASWPNPARLCEVPTYQAAFARPHAFGQAPPAPSVRRPIPIWGWALIALVSIPVLAFASCVVCVQAASDRQKSVSTQATNQETQREHALPAATATTADPSACPSGQVLIDFGTSRTITCTGPRARTGQDSLAPFVAVLGSLVKNPRAKPPVKVERTGEHSVTYAYALPPLTRVTLTVLDRVPEGWLLDVRAKEIRATDFAPLGEATLLCAVRQTYGTTTVYRLDGGPLSGGLAIMPETLEEGEQTLSIASRPHEQAASATPPADAGRIAGQLETSLDPPSPRAFDKLLGPPGRGDTSEDSEGRVAELRWPIAARSQNDLQSEHAAASLREFWPNAASVTGTAASRCRRG